MTAILLKIQAAIKWLCPYIHLCAKNHSKGTSWINIDKQQKRADLYIVAYSALFKNFLILKNLLWTALSIQFDQKQASIYNLLIVLVVW